MSHGQNHHANVIGSGGFWKVKLLDVYKWNTLDFNCITALLKEQFAILLNFFVSHRASSPWTVLLIQSTCCRANAVTLWRNEQEKVCVQACWMPDWQMLTFKWRLLVDSASVFLAYSLAVKLLQETPKKMISTAFLCTLSIMTVLGKCNVSEIRGGGGGEPLDRQQL